MRFRALNNSTGYGQELVQSLVFLTHFEQRASFAECRILLLINELRAG